MFGVLLLKQKYSSQLNLIIANSTFVTLLIQL